MASETFKKFLVFFLCTFIRSVYSLEESDLFPYDESLGTTRFYFDDDSRIQVNFTYPYKFFGKYRWSIQISGNGGAVFGNGTPSIGINAGECNPFSQDAQRILAFLSDADNRIDKDGTRLLYLETARSDLLEKAKNDIVRGFPELRKSLDLNWLLIVTWKDLLRHGANISSLRNTFQMVLAKSQNYSFLLLYYKQIQWAQGSNWAAGFDFGNSNPMYTLPGSCTGNFTTLTTTGNIGSSYPGKWIFRVDTNLKFPKTKYSSSNSQLLDFKPQFVSVMGNVPIYVRNLHLTYKDNVNVTCKFRDPSRPQPIETTGIPVKDGVISTNVICPVPFLYSLGRINITVLVSSWFAAPSTYEGHIYAVKEHEAAFLARRPTPHISTTKTDKDTVQLSAVWHPTAVDFNSEILAIDMRDNQSSGASAYGPLTIVLLENNGKIWKELGEIASSVSNTGSYTSALHVNDFKKLIENGRILPRVLALKRKYTMKSGSVLEQLLPSNDLTNMEELTGNQTSSGNVYDRVCKNWNTKETPPPTDALPCPRTEKQAHNDWRFMRNALPHPNSSASYIQSVPSASGAGSLCNYNYRGNLLIVLPGAGRLHRHSPNNYKNYWDHLWRDVMPYMYCCKWSAANSTNCPTLFYQKRPIDDGSQYEPPQPARVTGLSHLTTFDGINYTFLRSAEFWLLKYTDKDDFPAHSHLDEFKMQVRLEPFSPDFKTTNVNTGSVITSVVMEDSNSKDSPIKVQVSKGPRRISVLVNGEPLGNEDDEVERDLYTVWTDFNLYLGGATISIKSDTEVVMSFASGVSVFIMSGPSSSTDTDPSSTIEKSLNIIVAADSHLMNKTAGLLGDFDGDSSNDLKLPNGTLISVEDTGHSMLDIHNEFPPHWVINKNESLFIYPVGATYDDYNHPDLLPLLFDMNSTTDNSGVCRDHEECKYDYFVTNGSLLAVTGKGAFSLYEEVLDVATDTVNQCDLPPVANGQAYLNDSSLVIGSNMAISCNSGYRLNQGVNGRNFTCWDEDTSKNLSVRWVNSLTNETMPALLCIVQETKVPVIPVRSTSAPKSETRADTHSSKFNPLITDSTKNELHSESSSHTGLAVFLVLAAIVVIVIAAVVVVRYRRAGPQYFATRFGNVRASDIEVLDI